MERLKHFYGQLDKKTRKYLLLIGLVVVVLQVTSAISSQGHTELEKEDLKLPEYGQSSVSIPVDVHYDDGTKVNRFNTVIELEPKKYSEDEARVVMENVAKELPVLILGANSSIAEVHSNLNLVNIVEGYPVYIDWYSTNYELVDSAGNVGNSNFEQGHSEDVTLFALVSCGEYSRECAITITVVSKELSWQEIMIADINKQINTSLANCSDGYGELPGEYNGGKLSYYRAKDEQSSIWTILGFAAAAAVVIGDSKQKKQAVAQRNMQLSFDYSEVVSKITLLMGAGMTIQRAWERIVIDYKSQRDKKGQRYVYEEMLESYNQMKAGIPETEVYEQFAKRCDIKEYQKFSTLIVQNLKKGTKDLTALLELEAIEAFEKRKNMAKVKGEEAGTKLLVPMIMMLVVVMIVVMVPALMTFEM